MANHLDVSNLPSSHDRLARDICTGIRVAIGTKIPDFRDGTIAIRFEGMNDAAIAWLYGLPYRDYNAHDGTLHDHVFKATVSGSTTRPAGWRDDPENIEVNCAGYVMLKLEACAYAVTHGLGRCSDDMPESAEIYGRAADPGAVCFDLVSDLNDNDNPPLTALPELQRTGQHWLRIYVGVSGATGAEDKECALQAYRTIMSWLQHSPNAHRFHLLSPNGCIEVVS